MNRRGPQAGSAGRKAGLMRVHTRQGRKHDVGRLRCAQGICPALTPLRSQGELHKRLPVFRVPARQHIWASRVRPRMRIATMFLCKRESQEPFT